VFDTTIHKTQDKDKQNKNTTQYVFDTTIHKTQDKNTKSNTNNNTNQIHNSKCTYMNFVCAIISVGLAMKLCNVLIDDWKSLFYSNKINKKVLITHCWNSSKI
jgi:hypothetical protein